PENHRNPNFKTTTLRAAAGGSHQLPESSQRTPCYFPLTPGSPFRLYVAFRCIYISCNKLPHLSTHVLSLRKYLNYHARL
ncbi:MAG: hypothetical protein NZM35_08175, partial [Chitinophagales bacterium]|nr:hypothetical protein [Chitinophagales bacterium]MDW8420033.1 hypothetical protein [Chitinophagales bacterium]